MCDLRCVCFSYDKRSLTHKKINNYFNICMCDLRCVCVGVCVIAGKETRNTSKYTLTQNTIPPNLLDVEVYENLYNFVNIRWVNPHDDVVISRCIPTGCLRRIVYVYELHFVSCVDHAIEAGVRNMIQSSVQ